MDGNSDIDDLSEEEGPGVDTVEVNTAPREQSIDSSSHDSTDDSSGDETDDSNTEPWRSERWLFDNFEPNLMSYEEIEDNINDQHGLARSGLCHSIFG